MRTSHAALISPVLVVLALAGCAEGKMSGSYGSYAYDSSDTGSSFVSADTADTDTQSDSATDTGVCTHSSDNPITLYMSADDSNSQATPVLARAAIDGGRAYNGPARKWEFLNYYDFDYQAADAGTVRIVPQMEASQDYPGDLELVVAVVAPHVSPADREPLSLTFALDTSCSMGGQGLAMAEASMQSMAHQLRSGDTVSLVTWSSSANTVLDGHVVAGPDDAQLLSAISGLRAGDDTDLSNGLSTAYRVADRHTAAGTMSRVVLISDGGANAGQTDESLIGDHAAAAERDSVYLIGVGVGDAGSYNTTLMDVVTDKGRGAHVFIDSASEAAHQFDDDTRFLQNLGAAATDVKLAMTLPAGWVIDRFSGEQISTQSSDVIPQNLGADDQMIYHLTVRACGGDPSASFHFDATWSDTTGNPKDTQLDADVPTMSAATGTQVAKAVALVDAATAIEGVWAEPQSGRQAYIDAAVAKVQSAIDLRPDDGDLAEVKAELSAMRNEL